MNDDLFPIPPAQVSELEHARIRLAKAREDYENASEFADNTGNAIPAELEQDCRDAELEVTRLESAEITRRRNG